MESVIQNERECYVCGKEYPLHVHHCLSGTSNRKLADEDGLTICLCPFHHEQAHRDPYANDMYKRLGQIYYEKTHTRKEFIERYGKSFITD